MQRDTTIKSHDGNPPPLSTPPDHRSPDFDKQVEIERERRLELIVSGAWRGPARQDIADGQYDDLDWRG